MASPEPLIDLSSARVALKQLFDNWTPIKEHIESHGGHLKLRPEAHSLIEQSDVASYPLIYEELPEISANWKAAVARASDLFIPALNINLATPADRGRFLVMLLDLAGKFEAALGLPISEEDKKEASTALAALPPALADLVINDQMETTRFMLAMFHEYLSISVNGLKLSALVALAKQGDDMAFIQAVRIDRRIISVIPHFVDRHARAWVEGDGAFLSKLVRNAFSSPHKGRLQQASIWLALDALEWLGLLKGLSGEALLDFCNEVGANRGEQPIEDVVNMRKRLRDYRRYQNRIAPSMP